MKKTACVEHSNHLLYEDQVTFAREIGMKKYDGEPTHRPELSVWAWIVIRNNGNICHGYGGEPNHGRKQYMERSWQ